MRRTSPDAISRVNSQPGVWATPRPARTAARICSASFVRNAPWADDDLAELALEAPGPRGASRDERHALVAFQIAGAPRLAVPLEVLGRRDSDDGGGSNLPRDDRRVGEWTVVDGDVDALLYEVYGAIGHHDLDDDVGEAGEELPQLRLDRLR
jgi:hypothetical protein